MTSTLERILSTDTCIQERRVGGADADGNPRSGWEMVDPDFVCRWGSPRSVDVEIATQRNQIVDAVAARVGEPAVVGDRLRDLRGANWTVTHVHLVDRHYRHFLTRAGADE